MKVSLVLPCPSIGPQTQVLSYPQMSDHSYLESLMADYFQAHHGERNVTLKSRWDKDVKAWNVEQDNAKFDRRKPRWTKPKMPAMEKGQGHSQACFSQFYHREPKQ